MEKLEWLPLYIDNLLSSPAWLDMKDFQRGWYIQLLLRSTRSERLGYLPLDERLWALAGAHRREVWETHKSAVMTCFRTRTFDTQDWIYNPKLLSVLEDQSKKYRRRSDGDPPLISPVISDLDLGRSTSKAKPKSVEEVRGYCEFRNNCISPEAFFDYYEANGWKQKGGNLIKDWQAAVRTWEKRLDEPRNTADKQSPGKRRADANTTSLLNALGNRVSNRNVRDGGECESRTGSISQPLLLGGVCKPVAGSD